MKHTLLAHAVAAGAALSLVLGAAVPAAAQENGDCLSPHEIQEAIASGTIVTVDEAMAASGIDQPPLSSKVCRSNGSLNYHVNIMDAYGEAKPKVLDAEGE